MNTHRPNPDETSIEDTVRHELAKGLLQKISGPNATVTDEETREFIASVDKRTDEYLDQVLGGGDILAKYATGRMEWDPQMFAWGGPVSPVSRLIGEDRGCHPPINRDQFSRTLADHIAAQWPHTAAWDIDLLRAVPPALGTDPIGYIDGTTTTASSLTYDEVLAKVRDLYAKYVPPQPRAYRMHPDTIAALPHAEPGSLTGLGTLFGATVIPDDRIPRGWIAADDLLWHGGATEGDADGLTPADADLSQGQPSTDDLRPPPDTSWVEMESPQPHHWALAACILTLVIAVICTVAIFAWPVQP